jgi:hypothetical protein
MGLDTSHDCWHGPYSAFTRWRNCIALAAGYKVEPRKYDGGMTFGTAVLDWDGIEQRNPGCYQGEWREGEGDALVYLLAHSDCDGVLHPPQANALADRLAELVSHIGSVCTHHELDDHVGKTERFIKGLRAAVERGEDVDFH